MATIDLIICKSRHCKKSQTAYPFIEAIRFIGDKGSPFLDSVSLNWLTNLPLLVDFYFKINDEDSAAYWVWLSVVKPHAQANGQIIAVK